MQCIINFMYHMSILCETTDAIRNVPSSSGPFFMLNVNVTGAFVIQQ